jgi:hypothetical protein
MPQQHATSSRSQSQRMWFGIPEEGLMPVAMHPVQFHELWARSGTIAPERRLALTVLDEALRDLVRYRFARGRRGQRLYWEAYNWVFTDDHAWPFSFINLCTYANLAADAVREQVQRPQPEPAAAPPFALALGKAA